MWMLDMYAETKLLENSSLALNHVVLQTDVVLVQNQRRQCPAKMQSRRSVLAIKLALNYLYHHTMIFELHNARDTSYTATAI